jgi:hypothetical protein
MSYEPPLKVTIPIPSQIPFSYGPNSTGKRGGNLRVRCTNAEYDALQHEAKLLGLSLATFCRWSAVHVGQELLKHRESLSTDMVAGEEDGHDE